MLHCALFAEPPLLGISGVGQFHANQGQLPPSKEMPACPFFSFLCQSTRELLIMITSIQLLQQLTDIWSVGQSRSSTEGGGWWIVVPALCRCSWRRAGATLLALRSLLSGTLHFGHPQMPFEASTNAFWGTHKCPLRHLLMPKTESSLCGDCCPVSTQ